MTENKKHKLIIWSFGTSDLKLDGNIIKEDFLNKTKDIAENFNNYSDKISFHMFESFLEQIKLGSDIIVKGIFTDQKGYVYDTIHIKSIFDKYIKSKNIAKSAREHIIIENARRIEEVKGVIDEALKKIKQEDFETIFVVPTGGTKGMVSGLILSALSNLDLSKLRIFYGEENKNETAWLEQNNILDGQYIYTIENLQRHENYKAMIDFMELYDLKDKDNFKKYYGYAKYFNARLNADYDEAKNIYEQFKLNSRLYISDKGKNILEEAINGILYTRRTGRYIEFLGRVYNFTDIATNHIIRSYYNLGDDDLKYSKLKELASQDSDLKKFLDNYKISVNNMLSPLRRQDDDHNYINTKVAMALVEYISNKEEKYKKYIEFFKRIIKLNEYRNHTIIGHGIKPVSKAIIEEKYEGDIENDFKEFFESIFPGERLWIDFLKD